MLNRGGEEQEKEVEKSIVVEREGVEGWNGTELSFHLIGDLFHLLFAVFFFGNKHFCTPSHAKKTPLNLITWGKEIEKQKKGGGWWDRGMEMDFTCSQLTCIIGWDLFQSKPILVNMGKSVS